MAREGEDEGLGRVDGCDSTNPFVRFHHRLSASQLALANGLSDPAFLEIVHELDRAVAAVDGRGFAVTPFSSQPALAARLRFEEGGALLVKDETRNVSGSHKARHLFGVMLYLLVAERTGLLGARPRLAVASCGNAALAAAVVARAAEWPLDVFVPPSAGPSVLARVHELGASVRTCARRRGVPGDPCYLAFREAVARGAVPFCCQGSDNGLTIEGGKTLAWEMGHSPLDAVFVQVGGGALASSVVQGLADESRRGALLTRPRIYAVQTEGAHPLERAYERAAERSRRDGVEAAMAYARAHRSEFMWPWEEEPRSVAHGILDDETYDWAAVVEGMLGTGGRPLVVSEDRLREVNALGRSATGIDVDHTGSAGLAGLVEALAQEPGLRRERVAVIFSGVKR